MGYQKNYGNLRFGPKKPSVKLWIFSLLVVGLGVYGIWAVFAPEKADKKIVTAPIPKAPEPVPQLTRISDRILPGETLSGALERHSINRQEGHLLIQAFHNEHNLKSIQVGDAFVVERGPEGSLLAFELVTTDKMGAPLRFRVTNKGQNAGFDLTRQETSVQIFKTSLKGKIETSLYDAIITAGGDAGLVNRFAEVFGWQVDFYRESQPKDVFKIIAEARYAEGRFIGYGKVLAAEYDNKNSRHKGFYFESRDQHVSGIFNEKGESLARAFLKSPMELARITSRYGQRFHPVLMKQKKHNGIDYGAPTGTPFWSVADGVVVEARYSATAGKMVRIKHRAGVVTEYFHATRLAPNIRQGSRVKQKQIIGYVGSTGRSTGPHLHFGMKMDQGYVDPAKQKFSDGIPLPRNYQKVFKEHVAPLVKELELLENV